MSLLQPGILAPVPRVARYLTFGLVPEAGPGPSLRRLARAVDPHLTVVGVGRSTAIALGRNISALRDFPAGTGKGIEMRRMDPRIPVGSHVVLAQRIQDHHHDIHLLCHLSQLASDEG